MTDPGEMAIYKGGDGTILCKLVGWLRRDETRQLTDRELMVRTTKDALLVAHDTKSERIWVENCDQLPRWIKEHRAQLQRWSEDQKAEQRPVPAFANRRRQAAKKFHHRINSVVQEVVLDSGAATSTP